MKTYLLTGAILLTMGATTAHAGFGALTSKLTSTIAPENNTTLTSASDYTGYFTQVKETQTLYVESRASLASLLVNKETSAEIKNKLKTLKTTSDPKEKEALVTEINKVSSDVLSAAQKDEAATIETLSNLSEKQTNLLIDSSVNFVVASLKARDLAMNSKAVSMSLISNPKAALDSGLTVTDAKNLIGNVTDMAKNAGMALVEYPKLFKKAGIEFKIPESSATKPKEIDLDAL